MVSNVGMVMSKLGGVMGGSANNGDEDDKETLNVERERMTAQEKICLG